MTFLWTQRPSLLQIKRRYSPHSWSLGRPPLRGSCGTIRLEATSTCRTSREICESDQYKLRLGNPYNSTLEIEQNSTYQGSQHSHPGSQHSRHVTSNYHHQSFREPQLAVVSLVRRHDESRRHPPPTTRRVKRDKSTYIRYRNALQRKRNQAHQPNTT